MTDPIARDFPGVHPFGAVYLLERDLPWEEVERDVRVMAGMGYDLVTVWPAANAWLAQRPDEFRCDGTRRLLDCLHRHRLRAIVQLIGQNPADEFLPDCLLTPGMRVQDPLAGERRGSWSNCSWANPLHPGVDALVRRYLGEVIGQLADHPAVWAWDLFNEAHLRSDDAWTVAEYRRWLARRYDGIAALNRAWHRRYADFAQVDPADRMAPYSAWSSLLPQVDWEHFRSELTTAVCQRWAGYARALDPARPVIIDCVGGGLVAADATRRNADEFAIAGTCDVYGGTCYPRSWGRELDREPWTLALHLATGAAAARAAGAPFVLDELQTHTQSALTPGSEVEPGQLATWIWTAIGAGARATQLWRQRPFLHGYQATGRGLTRLDGTPGPRAAAVAALVTRLRRHQALIAAARPLQPAVALLTGTRNRLIFDAFRDFETPSRHADAVAGWWRLLWQAGLPATCGDLDHLDDPALAACPVLVLPAAIALSDAQAAWLAQRVRDGALLVADARLAAVDLDGVARAEGAPGAILAPVLGGIEREVGGAIAGTLAGMAIAGGFLSQEMEPLAGAEVLARDTAGRPLALANRYGRGGALYLPFHAGEVWRAGLDDTLVEWFAARCAAAAPQAVRLRCAAPVQRFLHAAGATRLAYLVNPGRTDASVDVLGIGAASVHLLDGDRLAVRDGAVSVPVPAGAVVLATWEEPGG